jgi:hypothetical protein
MGDRAGVRVTNRPAISWQTPFSIDECRERLADAIDVEESALSWSGYAGEKPILGLIRQNTFRLQRRPFKSSPDRRFLYGYFTATAGQTLINAEFRMRPWNRKLLSAWMAFCVLLLVAMLCFGQDTIARLAGAGLAVAMMMHRIGLTKLAHWLGRNDEKELVRLLKRVFHATEQ